MRPLIHTISHSGHLFLIRHIDFWLFVIDIYSRGRDVAAISFGGSVSLSAESASSSVHFIFFSGTAGGSAVVVPIDAAFLTFFTLVSFVSSGMATASAPMCRQTLPAAVSTAAGLSSFVAPIVKTSLASIALAAVGSAADIALTTLKLSISEAT